MRHIAKVTRNEYLGSVQANFSMFRATFFSAHLLFTIVGVSAAQEIRFDHISTEDGLSQDIVNGIIQDRQGFMWFGTEDGLNRYDGYGIHVYKHNASDSFSISDNWITVLFVDREGRLWIGTNAGLNLYDARRDRFIRMRHENDSPSPDNPQLIMAVIQDSSGTIWAVTGDGIHRLDQRASLLIEPRRGVHQSETATTATQLLVDRRGVLWAGTTNGLYEVDTSAQTIIVSKRDASHPLVRIGGSIGDIVEDRQGNLWIAIQDSGVFRFDTARRTVIRYTHRDNEPQSLSANIVLSLCIDTRGRVWAGTFSGLDLYNPKTNGFVHYFPDPTDLSSLSGSRMYKVYADRAGALWVGTYRGGVSRFDPLQQRFLHYRHRPRIKESLSNDEVYCLAEDLKGRLWVGTAAGVDRFDRSAQRFQHLVDAVRHLGGSPVTALRGRSDGNLWVGTERGSLYLVDSVGRILRTFLTTADEKSRLGHWAIKALHETADGKLWIGTSQAGLMYIDTRDWQIVQQPLKETGVSLGLGVWLIHEDRRGDLWFGGWGGSAHLVKYNPSTREARQYAAASADSASTGDAARTIYEDSTGILWIGTWGGGLKRYDPESDSFSVITEQDGLSNNFVKGILADAADRLWISTERGLTRYDPRTGNFKRYTKGDGLQGDRFLSGSFCRGTDGWMYFGGENGFNAFHPDSVRDNSYLPPVVITKFRILDRPTTLEETVKGTPVVRLDYHQDYFSFEFVALNYTQVQNNQYAYMMEGFDRDWIQCGTRRYAAYMHLDGGTYTFRVKASNNDGVWNNAGASVVVIINPPFWKTWWFYTIATAMAFVLLSVIYRNRVRRAVEIERFRTRIASDLHDELASNLTSIAMFGKIILGDSSARDALPGHTTHLLERITVLSQDSITAIRDIIWAIDPRTETLHSLLQRLSDSVTAECSAANIALSVEIPPEDALPAKNLTPEQRKHLWLILKEAVHNALKHSQCTSINVKAQYENQTLTISVRDNGRGIIEQPHGSGKGLQTMRMRAGQLGGRLSLTPNPLVGTNVMLTMRF